MAKTSAAPSREILEAALVAFESQRQRLDEQIAKVRSLLGRRVGLLLKSNGEAVVTSSAAAPKKRRGLSAEARKRIAAAQKKRWAAFRKTQG